MLAAALFMRILVPAGWMPVADASGLRVQLCSGWTSEPNLEPTAHHRLHHGDHRANGGNQTPRKESSHSGQPCAFAGLGLAFLNAPDLVSIAALPFEALTPSILPPALPSNRLAAPPPHSTGPPIVA